MYRRIHKNEIIFATKEKTKNTLTKTGKQRKSYEQSNKNNEVRMFMDYINTHHNKLKSMYATKQIVFVCDRGYHSYDLFYLLEKYDFKYIIRLKDNNLINQKKNTKNKNALYFKKNARHITYKLPLNFEYTDNQKKEKCTIFSEYNILTNLTDSKRFDDQLIEKIYHIRWQIEIYFKFAKKNTKMGLFREKNSCKHKIMRTSISIVNILLKILIHIYLKSSFFKKEDKGKFLNNNSLEKINYSCLVDGLYQKFLTRLVKNDYKHKEIIQFMNCYFITHKNEENRSFPRESLLPFSKWYVKKYHKIYDMATIIVAIKNKKINKLHKNLKKKAIILSKCIIFEIT